MKTKENYIAEAIADNPKPLFFDANGIAVKLTDDEYNQAIEAWAEMRIEQDNAKNQNQELLQLKNSALIKLGLTADEASALFG